MRGSEPRRGHIFDGETDPLLGSHREPAREIVAAASVEFDVGGNQETVATAESAVQVLAVVTQPRFDLAVVEADLQIELEIDFSSHSLHHPEQLATRIRSRVLPDHQAVDQPSLTASRREDR